MASRLSPGVGSLTPLARHPHPLAGSEVRCCPVGNLRPRLPQSPPPGVPLFPSASCHLPRPPVTILRLCPTPSSLNSFPDLHMRPLPPVLGPGQPVTGSAEDSSPRQEPARLWASVSRCRVWAEAGEGQEWLPPVRSSRSGRGLARAVPTWGRRAPGASPDPLRFPGLPARLRRAVSRGSFP